MGSPIIQDIGMLKDRWPAQLGPQADATLAMIAQGVTDHIEGLTGRIFVKGAIAIVLNGDDARGRDKHILPLVNPPVSGTPVVTENGVALLVTTGYDGAGAYDVAVDPGGPRQVAKMYRTRRASSSPQSGAGWAPGIRNVTVTYQGGFDPVPQDIVNVAVELAYLMWQQGGKAGGMESMSLPNMSARAGRQLSEASKSVIQSYILWGAL